MSKFKDISELLDKVEEIAGEEGVPAAGRFFYTALQEAGDEFRLNNLYCVLGKSGKKVPFKFNVEQARYWKDHTNWDIVLKSRQEGFTTLACLRAVDRAIFDGGSRCGIMAHAQTTVHEIFKIVRRTFEWFKQDWAAYIPIVESAENRTEVTLSCIDFADGAEELRSSVQVAFDFKGFTLNFLHLSEAAFMDDTRMSEALQCVPHNGTAVWESTPNGMGGTYYDGYMAARKGEGKYRAFFAPWFKFYPEPDDPILESDKVLVHTSVEARLFSQYGTADAALLWRRNKIISDLKGDEQEFERLYPSNEEDCFFSGENLFFPSTLTSRISRSCRKPQLGELLAKGKRLEFDESDGGRFLIWERPKEGQTYVMGVDPSSGVGKDAGVAYIKNRITGEQVAAICGQLTVDEMAACAIRLATFYHLAHINPESNNMGLAVIEHMKRLGWKHFYKRRDIDSTTGKAIRTIGFLTTKTEKRRILENFKAAVRNGKFVVRDPLLVQEMTVFIIDKTGRLCAKSGCHDDRVLAAALTEEMDSALPPPQDDLPEADDGVRYDPYTGCPI